MLKALEGNSDGSYTTILRNLYLNLAKTISRKKVRESICQIPTPDLDTSITTINLSRRIQLLLVMTAQIVFIHMTAFLLSLKYGNRKYD